MSKFLRGIFVILLFGGSIHATVYTDELPKFAGTNWAVAAADDSVVVTLVFHEASNVFSMHRYERGSLTVYNEAESIYEKTPTGFRIADPDGVWHTLDVEQDFGDNQIRILIDDTEVLDMTQIPADGTTSAVSTKECLAECKVACGAWPGTCCSCCTCVHECFYISFMDRVCCFYVTPRPGPGC